MSLFPSVVVLPAFAEDDNDGTVSEVQPWCETYDLEATEIPGIAHPVRHTPEFALVPTGIGKAAAATTVTALVANEGINVEDATFVTVGIAGSPPEAGTLGSVFVANTVVDWDPKVRIDGTVELPRWEAEYVWDLNPSLVDRARAAAETAELADSGAARELRTAYDDSRTPAVDTGPTIGSDELYHGRQITAQVEQFCEAYGLEGFVTTEMESAGTALALERFGLLDQYVSVRGVSNFDREPPGGDATRSIDHILFELGVKNAVSAGKAVVDEFTPAGSGPT